MLVKTVGHSFALSSTLSCSQFMPTLTCSNLAPRPPPDTSVSRYMGLDGSYNFIHASIMTISFPLSYRSWYMLFHVKSSFTNVSFCRGSHTSIVTGENLPRYFSVPRNDFESSLDFGGSMSVCACTFLGSKVTPWQEITSQKMRMLGHLKRHLSFLSFNFIFIHSLNTLLQHHPCAAHQSLQLKCNQQ